MKGLNLVAQILIIVGAINWGLVGAFNFNLVAALFGGMPTIERVIYVLVGIAGIYGLYLLKPLLTHADK